jgi:hypothetical protein
MRLSFSGEAPPVAHALRSSEQAHESEQEKNNMPILLWLLGVPLGLVVLLWLLGIVH